MPSPPNALEAQGRSRPPVQAFTGRAKEAVGVDSGSCTVSRIQVLELNPLVERTCAVLARVLDPRLKVFIETGRAENVLTIPLSTVIRRNEKDGVWVADKGVVRWKPVLLGLICWAVLAATSLAVQYAVLS